MKNGLKKWKKVQARIDEILKDNSVLTEQERTALVERFKKMHKALLEEDFKNASQEFRRLIAITGFLFRSERISVYEKRDFHELYGKLYMEL